jgi:hypothetical protein
MNERIDNFKWKLVYKNKKSYSKPKEFVDDWVLQELLKSRYVQNSRHTFYIYENDSIKFFETGNRRTKNGGLSGDYIVAIYRKVKNDYHGQS